jgi:hypothetical protein
VLSTCNSQPWKLTFVDELELKNEVAKTTFNKMVSFNKFALEAPVIAVFVIEKAKLIAKIGGVIKNQEYPQYDIGIAAEHFCYKRPIWLWALVCWVGLTKRKFKSF